MPKLSNPTFSLTKLSRTQSKIQNFKTKQTNSIRTPKPILGAIYKCKQRTLLERWILESSKFRSKCSIQETRTNSLKKEKHQSTQRNKGLLSNPVTAAMCLQTYSTHGISVWFHTERNNNNNNNVTKSRWTINGKWEIKNKKKKKLPEISIQFLHELSLSSCMHIN